MKVNNSLISAYRSKFNELSLFQKEYIDTFYDDYTLYFERVFIYRGIICVVFFENLYRGGLIAVLKNGEFSFLEYSYNLIDVHGGNPYLDDYFAKDFLLLGVICNGDNDAHDYDAAIRYGTVRPGERFYSRPDEAIIRTQEYVRSQLESMVDQIKKLR